MSGLLDELDRFSGVLESETDGFQYIDYLQVLIHMKWHDRARERQDTVHHKLDR